MKEVNLVVAVPKKKTNLEILVARFYPFIVGLIILLVISTGVVLILYFSSDRIMKKNDQKIELLSSDIKKQAQNESYLLIIYQNIKTIENIFNTNQFKSSTITEIKSLMVPGYSLLNFEISPLLEYKVYGTCADSQCLTNLNERLEEINQKGNFSNISLPTVKKQNGIYKVYVELKK